MAAPSPRIRLLSPTISIFALDLAVVLGELASGFTNENPGNPRTNNLYRVRTCSSQRRDRIRTATLQGTMITKYLLVLLPKNARNFSNSAVRFAFGADVTSVKLAAYVVRPGRFPLDASA